MQNDGLYTLQPTALAIKQAPSSSATLNAAGFPAEITITLRHLPQPEHLAKSCGRANHNTYHAYLVNTCLNTKTFLGTVAKMRPGTFQLIAENIPCGIWDQCIVSLAQDSHHDLGTPLFSLTQDFRNLAPPERFTVLPADFPQPDERQIKGPIAPKIKFRSRRADSTGSEQELLKPGIPSEEGAPRYIIEEESLLLQPGKVLPESEIPAGTPGLIPPSHQKVAPMDGPGWFSSDMPKEEDNEVLTPVVINELPQHNLWLINYQGLQLVGYVFNPANPAKPTFIVHGVPGDDNRGEKPQEQGYDYWVPNPAGTGGYWLRYISPDDNQIAHPFPVK